MEMIRLNHHFAKVKGALLMVLVAIGGALGNMLIFAEDYFDLQKAIICAVVFIALVFLYVHLEHIDPEVDSLKEFAAKIKEKVDEEVDHIEMPEDPNPPS